MYDEDELLDLFDSDERVVDTVRRGDYYKNQTRYRGLYLRSAELFIVNDRGQFWVPIRTLDKKIAPGGLDYSAGGHVAAGESYETGLIREIEEELELRLNPQDLQFVAAFTPNDSNPWFRKLFMHTSNDVPNYNRDDFSGYSWMFPSELFEQLAVGVPAKASMHATVEKVVQLNLNY